MRFLATGVLALSLLLPPSASWSATPAADIADRATFDEIIAWAQGRRLDAAPFAQIVQSLATQSQMLGRPYAKAPLDGDPGDERLYAGFARFDCVTFVETVLALAQTVAIGQDSAEAYESKLAALRYRDGRPAYCSRLHYFSDWTQNNAIGGRLDEVTAEVAGDVTPLVFRNLPHGLDHLSRRASTNPALAGDPARQACVREAEEKLGAMLAHSAQNRIGFAYIPSAHLDDVVPRLHGGDVLTWVSNRSGLDVMHVGIVIERNGEYALAHASQRDGRVEISSNLLRYAATLPGQLGVRVLRPRDPR